MTVWSPLRAIAGAVLLASLGACQSAEKAPTAEEVEPVAIKRAAPGVPTPFVRAEARDGRTALLTGACDYRAEGLPTTVSLVGVVHIGDRAYYDRLSEHLATHELVLYESVLPRGAFGASGDDDLSRQHATQDAMLFLRSLAMRASFSLGRAPSDLGELRTWVVGEDSRLARPFDLARTDAWGRPVAYESAADATAFSFRSFGADGKPGGARTDRDLVLPGRPKPKDDAKDDAKPKQDLYREMAEALDVDLQVRSMHYDREGWLPADMALEDMLDRLWERGERSFTLEMLSKPDGFQQTLLRFLLSFVSKSPGFKRMVIEMLGKGDEPGGRKGGLGDAEERLIIVERNDAVLEKLGKILAQPNPPRSIAIFYGAGHMADFERQLAERFGMTPSEPRWFEAMSVDEWSAKQIEARIKRVETARASVAAEHGEDSAEVRKIDDRLAALRARLDARR